MSSLSSVMVTSPYKRKIVELDYKPQLPNKKYFKMAQLRHCHPSFIKPPLHPSSLLNPHSTPLLFSPQLLTLLLSSIPHHIKRLSFTPHTHHSSLLNPTHHLFNPKLGPRPLWQKAVKPRGKETFMCSDWLMLAQHYDVCTKESVRFCPESIVVHLVLVTRSIAGPGNHAI